jgi:peptidoglycan hydrolase CwlO-like protein
METSSHENSALAEEYEEEINNLKSKIKSMEFQIADLKSFIINQKHLHAK